MTLTRSTPEGLPPQPYVQLIDILFKTNFAPKDTLAPVILTPELR